VTSHPLGQVLLIRLRSAALLCPRPLTRCVHRRPPRLSSPAHGYRLDRNHRRGRRQQ